MSGRILKVKTGYNPNSSSIGVDLVVFFTAGAAVTVFFNVAAALAAAWQAARELPSRVPTSPEDRGTGLASPAADAE